MRFMIAAIYVAFVGTVSPAATQQTMPSSLRQLENAMLSRIAERAEAVGGFRLGSSEFDLRLSLRGEAEEIAGPTTPANDALATGSARIEPLDRISSRDTTFKRARYDLRIERGFFAGVVRETFP